MKKTILPKKNIIAQTKTTSPFGHSSVKAQRDSMKGHAKELVMGKGVKTIIPATRLVKGLPVIHISGKLPVTK